MKSPLKKLLTSWRLWVGGINIFLVVVTVLQPHFPSMNQFPFYYFGLSTEMNVAIWWSAMILLITALLAYEAFSTSKNRNRLAWLALSAVLMMLSVDELGSLHERAGGMRNLLPYIAGFALLMLGTMAALLKNKETRRAAIWITIGFGLFGLVPVQEYFEHTVSWEPWMKGIRYGIEEGSELLAVFLVLEGLAGQRERRAGLSGIKAAVPNPFKLEGLQNAVLGALLLHVFFSVLAPTFPDLDQRGNPAVWFPSALFILLACEALWRYYRSVRGRRKAWLFLSGYFVLISLIMVYLASPRHSDSIVYSLGLFSNPSFFLLFQLIFIALFDLLVFKGETKRDAYSLALAGLFLLFSFFIQGQAVQFILIGFFNYFLVSPYILKDREASAVSYAV